jgi:hypothetical protein
MEGDEFPTPMEGDELPTPRGTTGPSTLTVSSNPLAIYDVPNLKGMEFSPVGNRGHGGEEESLTTTFGSNNDLVITARNASYANDPPITVAYAVVANNAPALLYQDGTPSKLISNPDKGFTLISRSVGRFANQLTLTLVDPGVTSPLVIQRPGLNDIVITLARSAGAITTTTAQLVAAINNDPEISSMVVAVVSNAGTAGTLVAVPKQNFIGGQNIPRSILVSLANNAGTVTSTGRNVQGMLNGSRYVSASPAGASTGAGVMVAMGATPLSGGVPSRGEISDALRAERDYRDKVGTRGNPIGKERNQTVQVRSDRFGAPRTWQRTPRQDRSIVASRPLNHQMSHNPGVMEWF